MTSSTPITASRVPPSDFDLGYAAGVDYVTAGVISSDRAHIARLAVLPAERQQQAEQIIRSGITGAGGSYPVYMMTASWQQWRRGWLAGFADATVEACKIPGFAALLAGGHTRRAAVEGAGHDTRQAWMICSACGDTGRFYEDRIPVACGYCASGLYVVGGG